MHFLKRRDAGPAGSAGKRRRRWLWSAATVVLVLMLVSHPELRLLVPILDALGLDVLFAILGLQLGAAFTTRVLPLLLAAWGAATPLLRWLDRVSLTVPALDFGRELLRYGTFHWLGDCGPRVWFALHRFVQAACQGPRDETPT